MQQGIKAEHVAIANSTSRNRGAVGARAVVPRYVRETYGDLSGLEVLDFGAGKAAAHAEAMQEAYGSVHGWNVDAFEFGDNYVPGVHLSDREADLSARRYGIVYASNVLNVQCNWSMMHTTVAAAAWFLSAFGRFVANYPESPRKSDLTPDDVEALLRQYFVSVRRVAGTKRAPVFECTNAEGAL
jgi:hypothetical protein